MIVPITGIASFVPMQTPDPACPPTGIHTGLRTVQSLSKIS